MPYITPADLAQRPGAREIAQVASLAHQMVRDDALMDATLRGAERSAWSAPEQHAADAALARVHDAIAEAAALIDGYLAQRGYHPLPLVLPASAAGKSVLTAWARAIARYLLNQNRISDTRTDPIARDYQDALKMLGLLAQGKYSLGAGDPEAAAGSAAGAATDVRFNAPVPTFGRSQLAAFR